MPCAYGTMSVFKKKQNSISFLKMINPLTHTLRNINLGYIKAYIQSDSKKVQITYKIHNFRHFIHVDVDMLMLIVDFLSRANQDIQSQK